MLRTLIVVALLLNFATIFYSCTKSVVEEVYIDTVITNINPPPYDGVSEVQISNYVNKMYIDLLGREASSDELGNAKDFLSEHKLSMGARDSVIQRLVILREYYARLTSMESADFINATDSSGIAYEIDLLEFVWHLDSINGNAQNYIYYQAEINKLVELQNSTDDYYHGSITVNEYFSRFLNNYFYDQVNMGSENFVRGSFDDLFRRVPTESELANGVTMVDNASAILFLESGNSKGDYIQIVTTCDEFYEGLVKKTYEQLLLRDPNSQESSDGTTMLKSSLDFPAFEKSLIKTDEYAGF